MTIARTLFASLLFALVLPAQEYRAFWANVNSAAFKTPENIDCLLEDLATARCNAIFAQMRSRATSYYRVSLEPFAEDSAVPQGFDPLAYLIERAHQRGIEVHAWFPVTPFWNLDRPPQDAGHAWHAHGPHAAGADMWLTISNLGKVINYVDPGNPGAMRYLADVIVDAVRNYEVDGLHLDYIRYPAGTGYDFGWNPAAVERFNRIYEASGQPARDDVRFAEFRRRQVTDLVRQIYLRALAVRPSLRVSAALITWDRGPVANEDFDKTDAYRYVFQDWRSWLEEGIIDLGIGMNYFEEPKRAATLDRWMEFEKDHQYRRSALIGLGVYMNSVEDSLEQMRRARLPSAAGRRALGLSMFSYAATNTGAANTEFYQAAGALFGEAAAPPDLPWKNRPESGNICGRLTVEGGSAGRNDNVTIYMERASTGEVIATTTDATGFFGAVDLAPDSYRVGLSPGQWISEFKQMDAGMTVWVTMPANVDGSSSSARKASKTQSPWPVFNGAGGVPPPVRK
jgi:uncharacterized lipoprotein YddW (UPF0748 family)